MCLFILKCTETIPECSQPRMQMKPEYSNEKNILVLIQFGIMEWDLLYLSELISQSLE